jgi:hypothetical protein
MADFEGALDIQAVAGAGFPVVLEITGQSHCEFAYSLNLIIAGSKQQS